MAYSTGTGVKAPTFILTINCSLTGRIVYLHCVVCVRVRACVRVEDMPF